MTIARRLSLLVGLLMAAMLAVALLGAWGTRQAQQAMQGVHADRVLPLQQLANVQDRVTRNRVLLGDAVLQAAPTHTARQVQEAAANRAAADADWTRYMATRLTAEESALAATVQRARETLTTQGHDAVIAALKDGNFSAGQTVLEGMEALDAPFSQAMDKLIALQVRLSEEEFGAAQAGAARLNLAGGTVVVLALLLAVATGVGMTRSLLRALGAEPAALAAVAERVAEGRLADDGSPPAPPGSVMASMQAMRQSLLRLVGSVRSGVDSVATASAQIAQGNADLSSRTEQQAASLQQTAASMEQLTGIVRQGSESAHQANQLAQSASQAAERGGEEVARVVQTMSDIQAASQRIAEITGVIDGIAFQTNILALNAAVEAARAGEQGRGFAVVATEVRTLAQRSAEAARQIKALIGDSVNKVEGGSALVNGAGVTIADVVAQVHRVTELIGGITAAAGEQNQGIAQVGQAVTMLDQTTQQNAALVEESAAAAESLKAQAARLAEAVAVFRV